MFIDNLRAYRSISEKWVLPDRLFKNFNNFNNFVNHGEVDGVPDGLAVKRAKLAHRCQGRNRLSQRVDNFDISEEPTKDGDYYNKDWLDIAFCVALDTDVVVDINVAVYIETALMPGGVDPGLVGDPHHCSLLSAKNMITPAYQQKAPPSCAQGALTLSGRSRSIHAC